MTLLPPDGVSDAAGNVGQLADKTLERSSDGQLTPDEEFKPGMITNVKNLYQSKPDTHGKTTWVDKYPDNLEEAAENAESARYALLVRNKKCYDGRKSLEIESIAIQSPLLKDFLGKHVLNNYPGITCTLERLNFSSPFRPLVHRWQNLVHGLEEESDPEVKAHVQLFHGVLKVALEDDLKGRDDFILNGVITYSTCWMIFEPGTIVFTVKDGEKCAVQLGTGSYVQTKCGNAFALQCTTVDWDGENFGHGNAVFSVWGFEGTMEITKLSAFPLEYHPKLEEVKQELIIRGKTFEALSGYHYKNYQGIAIGEGPWGPVKYNVDSRIIIDTYAWNRFNPNRQVSLSKLARSVGEPAASDGENFNGDDEDGDDEDEDDEDGEQFFDEEYEPEVDSGSKFEGVGEGATPMVEKLASLTEDQLLLCCASLRGYSLRNKKWLTFSIRPVKEIKWSEKAFESLVLPEDHKELILALTESQVENKGTFDDVIQGKGKGIIMLLSGPPGVGKTLTAESVAEQMKSPLYMLAAGDLGLSSSNVESSLSNVLEMATKWNAILLLDEADVFLEQRSSNDLERNKLVSIFLRILEYYEGILFLTTNRVENIDAAFQSRIHLSMAYSELSTSARRHVWSNFLAASTKNKEDAFSDKDMDRLAGYKMNGREIKNVLKTAQLLASKKGVGLGVQHVESVLAIEKRHVGNQSLLLR